MENVNLYEIWRNGNFGKVKGTQPVNTNRMVQSFAACNTLRNSLFKSQGGYYKLKLDGTLEFVCRALYLITFDDLAQILKD